MSILDRYARLYSSLVSDCVEEAGLGPHCARHGLEPFGSDPLTVVVGWAFPAQVRKTSERVEIDKLLQLVQQTPADSVVVVAADADVHGALWGGLMSTGVRARGGRGAVVDGGVRDLRQITEADFPVWAAYRSPLDIRGRGEVVSFGEPVEFRGVQVAPGDLVLADANGVVFVPRSHVDDVLARCERRLSAEDATDQELAEGADPVEVYDRRGAF